MTQREGSVRPMSKARLAEYSVQIRYMGLWVELVQVANEMVKRGEAATMVAALGSLLGALESERERIIALVREVRDAAQ